MRSLLLGMIWLTISTTVALHFGALIVCAYAPHSSDIMWLLYCYMIVLVFTVTMWVAASSLPAEAAAQR